MTPEDRLSNSVRSREAGIVVASTMLLLVGCATGGAAPSASVADAATKAPSPTIIATPPPTTPLPAQSSAPQSTAPAPSGTLAYVTGWTAPATPFIHTIATDGTGDVELVAGSFPAWSPDGRLLAYNPPSTAEPAGLWLMNADGTDRRMLVPGMASRPQWSSDGTKISYDASGFDFGATWTIGVTGGNAVEIGPGSGWWSPDGLSFLLVSVFEGVAQVNIAAADGSHTSRVNATIPVTWSPDGRRIAWFWMVGDRPELSAMALDDGTVTTLFEFEPDFLSGSNSVSTDSILWVDDNRIAVARSSGSADPSKSGVYLADLASGELMQIASGLRIWSDLFDGLELSPDGDWLALSASSVASGDLNAHDVYLVSLGGEVVQVTTSGDAYFPTWRSTGGE